MQGTAKPKGLAKIWRVVKRPFVRSLSRSGCMCMKGDKLGLLYFCGRPNFGDILNIDVFNKMFGVDVECCCKRCCDMVAIGSLLQSFVSKKPFSRFAKHLRRRMFVWGTGFIHESNHKNEYFLRHVDVCAVRGYLTLERLKKITGSPLNNAVVADPGLLASRLFDTGNIKKKYAIGIVPHFVDEGNPLLEKIKVENSTVLDIKQPPKDFMERLAECENIISSAMHGLIAADSLGIPNVRMIVSDKIIGGDYKYNDYYSAFGIAEHNRIDLNKQDFLHEDLPSIRANYKISQHKVRELQDALIASFPYKKTTS